MKNERITALIAEWKKPLREHLRDFDSKKSEEIIEDAVYLRDNIEVREIADEVSDQAFQDMIDGEGDEDSSRNAGDVFEEKRKKIEEANRWKQETAYASGGYPGKPPVHLGDGIAAAPRLHDFLLLDLVMHQIEDQIDPNVFERPRNILGGLSREKIYDFGKVNDLVEDIELGTHSQDSAFGKKLKSACLMLDAFEARYTDRLLEDVKIANDLEYATEAAKSDKAMKQRDIRDPIPEVSPEDIKKVRREAFERQENYKPLIHMFGTAKRIIGGLAAELGISIPTRMPIGGRHAQ